jgi:hypothetical protein
MPTFHMVPWGLIGTLWLAVTLGIQQPITPIGPRHRIGQDPVPRPMMVPARPARPKVSRQADWAKGLSHAERLLALSQQVHSQIQAGPKQIPANLNAELKEIRKLAKQLRGELGY